MPGVFKKTMLFLGLGSDEDFDALDRELSNEAGPGPHRSAVAAPERPRTGAVRPLPAEDAPEPARPSVVRTIPAPKSSKPHVVAPVSFNDAQEVADAFKKNQPVIVNLQQADRDLTRRIIDFASGLCYGVGGGMKKVGDAVYLLSPDDVEVSEEDQRKLVEAGLFDSTAG